MCVDGFRNICCFVFVKFDCKDFACFLEISDNSNNTLHSVTLLKSPKMANLIWKIPVESLFSPWKQRQKLAYDMYRYILGLFPDLLQVEKFNIFITYLTENHSSYVTVC